VNLGSIKNSEGMRVEDCVKKIRSKAHPTLGGDEKKRRNGHVPQAKE